MIDRQHARPMETNSRVLFTRYRCQVATLVGLAPRLFRYVFFPRKLLKSFLGGRSYRSVAGSHNQVQLCCHPGGFKLAPFLNGPSKMGCWVKLNDRSLFSTVGELLLGFAFELG